MLQIMQNLVKEVPQAGRYTLDMPVILYQRLSPPPCCTLYFSPVPFVRLSHVPFDDSPELLQ